MDGQRFNSTNFVFRAPLPYEPLTNLQINVPKRKVGRSCHKPLPCPLSLDAKEFAGIPSLITVLSRNLINNRENVFLTFLVISYSKKMGCRDFIRDLPSGEKHSLRKRP
jgi:hypothetical protein